MKIDYTRGPERGHLIYKNAPIGRVTEQFRVIYERIESVQDHVLQIVRLRVL